MASLIDCLGVKYTKIDVINKIKSIESNRKGLHPMKKAQLENILIDILNYSNDSVKNFKKIKLTKLEKERYWIGYNGDSYYGKCFSCNNSLNGLNKLNVFNFEIGEFDEKCFENQMIDIDVEHKYRIVHKCCHKVNKLTNINKSKHIFTDNDREFVWYNHNKDNFYSKCLICNNTLSVFDFDIGYDISKNYFQYIHRAI